MKDKNSDWLDRWLKENEIVDKDNINKTYNCSNMAINKQIKKLKIDQKDFNQANKTYKFFIEENDSLEKWLLKNPVFDKDDYRVEKEIKMYPPKNLYSIRVDTSIDLHNLTVVQALYTLKHFIIEAFNRRDKVVKVIHGKGNHSINGPKVKTSVYKWLSTNGKGYIKFFKEAHNNHGGSGATIIWLK